MSSTEMQALTQMMFEGRAAATGVAELSVDQLREGMEQQLAQLPLVNGTVREGTDASGVPAEWTHPKDAETAGTLLYFHGGGYFQGSIRTHRRLVDSLCLAAGTRGMSVEYRLAPEHPFPAAVDDAVTAYRWLTGPGGEAPERVVIAGDSAGGGLSAALLVSLRDAGDPLPAGAFLLSPWTDLTGSGESMSARRAIDPMIDPDDLMATARRYLPDGDLAQGLASPLFAELAGLPPLLVQVGSAEVLYDDAVRLVAAARAADVDATMREWDGAFHVFQMCAGLVPEADEAVAEAGAWIRERLAAHVS